MRARGSTAFKILCACARVKRLDRRLPCHPDPDPCKHGSGPQVFLCPKSGEPVALKTNVLGLYCSHINKDVKPEDVTISCEKSGYRQERVFRRTEPGAMFIETDCTLRRL